MKSNNFKDLYQEIRTVSSLKDIRDTEERFNILCRWSMDNPDILNAVRYMEEHTCYSIEKGTTARICIKLGRAPIAISTKFRPKSESNTLIVN